MSRAFVAGATGYTGREVVRLLVEAGIQTIAHVRPDSPRRANWEECFGALGAEVDTTAWDPDAMTARFAALQPTHVFGLLGTTRKRGKAARKEGFEETYETVDYGLSAILIHACERLGAAPRFVYLSALGVSANASSAYAKARWKTEELLRQSTLPHVIARPGFIPGTDRDDTRAGEFIGAKTLDGVLALVGVLGGKKTQQRFQSISNTNLARALVTAALDEESVNRVLASHDLQRLGAG